MDERLRSAERLRKRSGIMDVIRTRGMRGRLMAIHIRENSGPCSRLAVVAPRSTGKAVERNRAKRRIRDIFRKNKRRLRRAVDIVIRTKAPIRDASYGEIAQELFHLLADRRLIFDEEDGKDRETNA